jgi:hypothetical protein
MPAPPSTAVLERSPQTAPQPLDDPGCDVCPHSMTHHDAIGLRFCRATRASAIDRGCVCRPL